MKRKIAAFLTALTLASGLSACGGKAPVSIDVTDATRIEETEAAVPGEALIVYSFVNGTMEEKIIREDREEQDGSWRVTENGVEKVYTAKEYNAISAERIQEKEHIHTLPYTCFYDMTPCTLEEAEGKTEGSTIK